MKQEVRRGRKFVEYHDPDTQDEFTFTQEISGADVSYQDESGNWLAADENWQTDGLDGFILKNDKLNHKIRLKGTGGRTWYPRRNVNTEYMTFGVPQYRNGNKWSNFSFSGWSVEGKTITLNTRQGVTILVHNRWNGIKIDWILASSAAPSRMRYPVSLTGITYVDGIIYGADGERLGQLTPTTATDSTFDEIGEPTQLPCSGSFASGYVEFQADVTGAVYPVKIDPDFSESTAGAYIASTETSTYESTDDAATYQSATSTVLIPGQRLLAGSYRRYRSVMKFDTSTIGANTISQVNLKLTATQDDSGENFDVQITKYNWSAVDPITNNNMSTAFLGIETTVDDSIWRNTSGMSLNTQYTSGNLSTAWVNKSGSTYYGLMSNLDRADDAPAANEYIYIASANHATEAYRPVLTVTYTAAGGFHPINMTAQMQSLTGGMRS